MAFETARKMRMGGEWGPHFVVSMTVTLKTTAVIRRNISMDIGIVPD